VSVYLSYPFKGGASEGVVSAIISGSSVALFDLCFVTPRSESFSSARFPSKCSISLNSSRYTALSVAPLDGREDFIATLEHIVKSHKSSPTDLRFFTDDNVGKIKELLSLEVDKEEGEGSTEGSNEDGYERQLELPISIKWN
jgi:hypothetical protein